MHGRNQTLLLSPPAPRSRVSRQTAQRGKVLYSDRRVRGSEIPADEPTSWEWLRDPLPPGDEDHRFPAKRLKGAKSYIRIAVCEAARSPRTSPRRSEYRTLPL